MHALTGLSRPTILKGMRELRAGRIWERERVRQLVEGGSAWRWPIRVDGPTGTDHGREHGWGSDEFAEMDAQVDAADRSGVDPPRASH